MITPIANGLRGTALPPGLQTGGVFFNWLRQVEILVGHVVPSLVAARLFNAGQTPDVAALTCTNLGID